MKLISVQDLTLKEFIGRNIPLYAILSHTWGDDEVSFEDIKHLDTARQKAGFKKIEFCRAQARADGLEWFWVDTCCIDKTSSAELSEAINSMFQWYSQAMVCYAYLSDVITSPGERSITPSLRNSRWFNRGWTLQELIAPLTVKFFSETWLYIGSKKELAPLLNEITGIPKHVLGYRANILRRTAYERMHWASRRETTREEDMAYCLLGLFDINMPLLYGEGKKAFHRLQEEIAKQHNDNTLFIWDSLPKQRINSKPSLEAFAAEVGGKMVEYTKVGTGPAFEKSFQIHEKELVVTLSSREGFSGPLPAHAKGQWIVWLSFREIMDVGLSETVREALLS